MQVSSHTHSIVKAKNAKGMSWAALAESLGATDVWVASCVYGENSMLPAMAEKLGALLDLDQASIRDPPIRGHAGIDQQEHGERRAAPPP